MHYCAGFAVGRMYCIACGSYRIVSHHTLSYALLRGFAMCIVSLAVRIISYHIIHWHMRYCVGFAACIVSLVVRIVAYYVSDRTIPTSCCTFSDRIKIPFSRFVFGSYPHFTQIVFSQSVLYETYGTIWGRYDTRGMDGSYSDRNAMI
jgi:hypothetical protein